ncbi:MAG: flagellar hook-length control protein FliK [Burkholderiales bacterium]|nr:flagellar hook-length control protein FliK [Burkholderiales bacterium]
MELPLMPLTPVPPAAGGASPSAAAPGDPAAADALAAELPGFAEVLAAELALPEGAPEAPASASDSQPGAGEAADGIAAAPAVTVTTDAALTLMLAAAAPMAARTGTSAAVADRAPEEAALPADACAARPRAEPAAPPSATPAPAGQDASLRTAGAATLPDVTEQTAVLTGASTPATAPHRAAPAAAPAAAALRAPVGAGGWDAQLGRTMLWMAGERHQVAEVRLNPPDLGPLEIHLRLAGEGATQASVSFASPHADVRAALEAALPRLREMLAESGLSLGQASVNAQSFRDPGGTPYPGYSGETAAAGGGVTPVPVSAVRAGTGLVDVFA